MKKQSLIKGSLILGIASIVARFLGLFFRWPLIMMIGDEGIGYYQLSYPLYMFFVAVALGVPTAMSKLISERNAVGDIEGSFEVAKESSYLMLLMGIGTTCILFCFAKPIISFLQWDPKAYYGLIGISFAPAMVSILSIYRGFFQGFQNMTPTGVSQLLEQIGRVVFGVGLAYILLPKGVEYSAGGAAFGAAAGAGLAAIYLYLKYRVVKKKMRIKKVGTKPEVLTEILKVAIPISIGATVGSIMNLIDSILVPRYLIKAGIQDVIEVFGQLTGKASVLVNIPLTLSMAIGASIIPIIAEVYILKRRKELDTKINLSLKLGTVIAFPCTIGLFLLSEPVMKLIFLGENQGANILKYLSLVIPFIIVTQTTTSILQGVNHYIRPILNLFIGCLVKIVLTIVLVQIPEINVFGAVIASIGAYVVIAILNLISLKKKIKFKVRGIEAFVKPLIASLVMGLVVKFSYEFLMISTNSNSISCLLSIFVGIIIYMMAIIILKVFKIEEIKENLVRK